MAAPLAELLEDSLALAEAQLEAARTLDAVGLDEATVARQDVLFELNLIDPDEILADPGLRKLVEQNHEIDQRLTTVLEAALSVFRAVGESVGKPSTYDATGQLRGGSP